MKVTLYQFLCPEIDRQLPFAYILQRPGITLLGRQCGKALRSPREGEGQLNLTFQPSPPRHQVCEQGGLGSSKRGSLSHQLGTTERSYLKEQKNRPLRPVLIQD